MIWDCMESEEVGIPKEAITQFLAQLKKDDVELDSLILISENKIIHEEYFKNWSRDKIHRVYSVGKSFTAVAIGLLREDGKLSFDDYICDFFEDKLPEEIHPFIAKMQVKHLLSMTTAHNSTTYNRYNGDWVESFFQVEPDHMPGTIFRYDTSATHVLSALVERLSGKDMYTYLREKVLDAIGFSESTTWLTDDAGVIRGGEGLSCTPIDLAAMARLFMNEGVYQGRELIPKIFIKEMTSPVVSTAHYEAFDEQFGYGYQIWGNRKGGYMFYGIGGQLAACFPEYNFILVTTADLVERSKDIKYIHNAFYDIIFPHLEKRK